MKFTLCFKFPIYNLQIIIFLMFWQLYFFILLLSLKDLKSNELFIFLHIICNNKLLFYMRIILRVLFQRVN